MMVSNKTSNQAAAHPPPGGRSHKITQDHPGSRESKAALILCSEVSEVGADFCRLGTPLYISLSDRLLYTCPKVVRLLK